MKNMHFIGKVFSNRWIGILLQFSLGGIALYLIINIGEVNWTRMSSLVTRDSIFPLLFSLLCFLAVMTLNAVRYSLLVKEKITFTYFLGLALFLNALLTFVPWRFGEFGYPWLMYRDHDVPIKNSVLLYLIIRGFDMAVLILGASWIAKNLALQMDINKIWNGLIVVGIIIVLGIVFVLLLRNRLYELLLEPIYSAKQILRPKILGLILVLSIFIFMAGVTQSMFAFRAIGLEIGLLKLLIFTVITLVVTLIPIHPPGGWGTIDSIQVFMILQFGYSLDLAASSIVVLHAYYTILILVGGIMGWFLRGRLHRVSTNLLTN